jgi:hypothetical protein
MDFSKKVGFLTISDCTPSDYTFIGQFIECFKPIYLATLKLQAEQLVYGDV